MVFAALSLFLPGAQAFCGTFVGAPGASLTNASSQVVIARASGRTTLTLVADYTGDAADFAMVLPIPEIIGPEDVTAGDSALVEWIGAWSTPRAVAYTCDDLFALQQSGPGCGYMMGCSDSSLMMDGLPQGELAEDSVAVEASFSAAGYDFVVLSAEESSDLFSWLNVNGYELPRGGDAILQEYIDAGVYFLAARVSMDAAPSGNTWLPPIRISYDTEGFSLPIRIGTISSEGPQEVVIYALTDHTTAGEVGISNYPEVKLDTECMWDGGDAEMSTWYGQQVEQGVADAGGAGWIKEYSADLVPTAGTGYHCDPCTAEPAIPGNSFAPLGLESDSAHLTRIRMRYDASTATEDLTLYETNILGASHQMRYIDYVEELEFVYPVCNEGWVENPGECPSSYVGGCTSPAPATALGVVAALALLRRRNGRRA